MDTELFELCRDAYKSTGFDAGSVNELDWYRRTATGEYDLEDAPARLMEGELSFVPLYTSDFLFDMLPPFVTVRKVNDGIGGIVYDAEAEEDIDGTYRSDSPLKALLKLTIALSEEGLL